MASFTTARFGEISVEPGKDVYRERTLAADGRVATPSLFISGPAEPALLGRAAALVDTLDALDGRARAALRADLDARPTSGTVVDFLVFHLEELAPDELRRLFGSAPPELGPAAVLAALELVGVGVHGAEPATFRVGLDYSVGKAFSDQLLVVRFDADGSTLGVSHES